MNKHLLILFTLSLLVFPIFFTGGTATPLPSNTTSQQTLSAPNQTLTERTLKFIICAGSLSPSITDITITNSSSLRAKLIERMISSKIIHLIVPRSLSIPIRNLDFTITYSKDIEGRLMSKRFGYVTSIVEVNVSNGEITNSSHIVKINEQHTIHVEGFKGFFSVSRARPLRLNPARFQFIGTYDSVTLST
jgi:hypothetical protein